MTDADVRLRYDLLRAAVHQMLALRHVPDESGDECPYHQDNHDGTWELQCTCGRDERNAMILHALCPDDPLATWLGVCTQQTRWRAQGQLWTRWARLVPVPRLQLLNQARYEGWPPARLQRALVDREASYAEQSHRVTAMLHGLERSYPDLRRQRRLIQMSRWPYISRYMARHDPRDAPALATLWHLFDQFPY
jgi:hypothetical protein